MKLRHILLLILPLLILGGCSKEEEYKVVQPLKRPGQSKTSDRDERIEKKKPKKTAERTPRPVVTPVKPAETPEVLAEPLVITALNMRHENGKPDGEGGWMLEKKGAMHTDVKTSVTLRQLEMEMKGDPAGEIWPLVELNFWDAKSKGTYFPWGSSKNTREYVTTSTYFNYMKPIEKPIPPGEYLVTFRYYNDDGTSSNEARNAYLRKIVLRP